MVLWPSRVEVSPQWMRVDAHPRISRLLTSFLIAAAFLAAGSAADARCLTITSSETQAGPGSTRVTFRAQGMTPGAPVTIGHPDCEVHQEGL